jgi:hypothetical protein
MSGIALRTGPALRAVARPREPVTVRHHPSEDGIEPGTTVTFTVEIAMPPAGPGDGSFLPQALRWLLSEASQGDSAVLPVHVTLAAGASAEQPAPIQAAITLHTAAPAPVPNAPVPGAQAPVGPEALHIIPVSRIVRRGGQPVELTRLEFDLLLHFSEHPGRVFTREQLLKAVWGDEFAGQRTVDVHIRRLRAKVGVGVPLVETVRGVGYRLAAAAPVVVDPGA